MAAAVTACVTSPPSAGYGSQPARLGYVPAATAILPCQVWPNGARYLSLPLSNAPAADMQVMCAAFDTAVLAAYNEQPFMLGRSPASVAKVLTTAQRETLPADLPALWGAENDACRQCSSPPAFYSASIAKRVPWLQWLADFGAAARNADAVLLPFITHAYERRYDDRGQLVAERAAGVTLLLIDTARGELIWAGGREAVVPVKRLATAPDAATLAPPPWAAVEARLYTEALWRDFPGRQVQ